MCKVIGIDISKQTFDVSFLENNKWVHSVFENNKKGFQKLNTYLTCKHHVVMEASGAYYLQLALFLFEKGIKVSVLNPLIIRRYSQMKFIRAKTDKKDARTIAEYGMEHNPSAWKPQEKRVLEIRQIYTSLELLNKQIHQTQRQLEAFTSSGVLCKELKKELKMHITVLLKRQKRLENKLIEYAQEQYEKTLERLQSIPGVGKKTAIMMTVITNNFQNFENYKQLIAYIGFSPRIFQSGTSVKGKAHICKMGKSQVRKLLYLCSWSAKRYNKTCIEMYERLKQKGKPERVVKIAIANKLVKQIFAIGKNNTIYNENYVQNICK
ncbi:MAG: IS110 family transposase [Polaribacter sp.]|nr:MAG: IS110 family transposase [Polaribacter sp.]